jgi:hypothetical protein
MIRLPHRLSPCIVVVALSLTSCTDRSPAAPSPGPGAAPPPSSSLDFGDGRYQLLITGSDSTFTPGVGSKPCEPALIPRGGKSISTFLWFTAEGDGVVGRSRPPYAATVELRIQPAAVTPLGTTVRGSVVGSVPDEYDRIYGRRDSTLVVAAPVDVTGIVPPRAAGDTRGAQLSGEWRGEMRFVDSGGATSVCTFVQYYVQPAPPGGADDDPSVPPIVPGLLRR